MRGGQQQQAWITRCWLPRHTAGPLACSVQANAGIGTAESAVAAEQKLHSAAGGAAAGDFHELKQPLAAEAATLIFFEARMASRTLAARGDA